MPKIILLNGSEEKQIIEVAQDTSLQDYLVAAYPESKNFPVPTIAMFKGQPILRKDWATTVLTDNDVAMFSRLPMSGGGGGSNVIGAILTIVVMVVALWAGPAIAGAMGMVSSTGALTAAGTVVSGLVTSAIALGGTLIIGKLFPPPSIPSQQLPATKAESASPTYSTSVRQNQARMYQVVPELFGKMRVVPDKISQSYSLYISNDMYLYIVLGLGRGRSQLNEIYMGEAKFWAEGKIIDEAYSDIELEIVESGQPVTLFPDNIENSYDIAGQELLAPNQPNHAWTGPFAANSSGSKTTEIIVDVVFDRGLGRYNDQGQLTPVSVSLNFEYRLIDDLNQPLSEFAPLFQRSFTDATLTAQRFSIITKLPEGRYQVQGKRISNSYSDGRTMETVIWQALKAVLPGTLVYEQQALALKIKANNISQTAASDINIIMTRILPEYKNGIWQEPAPTRSFAAAMAYALKAPHGAGLRDDQIDLDSLELIDQKLNAKDYTLDSWTNGPMLMWQLVSEWCSGVGVIPRIIGTGLSFVLEEAHRPVKFAFTSTNIIRNSFEVEYITHDDNTPDDIIMEYVDEEVGYVARDVRAVLPGSESAKPTRKRSATIVKRHQAHGISVENAAVNRHRRISCSFEVEGIGRLLNQGDIVTVNHPRFDDTTGGTVNGFDTSSLTVWLDAELNSEKGHYIGFINKAGQPWGPCLIDKIDKQAITLNAEDFSTLTLQTKRNLFDWINTGQGQLATGYFICTSKEFHRRMILMRIVPLSLYRYRIHCVNDAAEVYNYKIPVPPFENRQQLPSDTIPDKIEGLRVRVSGSPEAPILHLSWLPAQRAAKYQVEISYDNVNWLFSGNPLINSTTLPVMPGLIYVRVAAFASLFGAYSYVSINTLQAVPDAPSPCLLSYVGAELQINWAVCSNYPDYYLVSLYLEDSTIPIRIFSVSQPEFSYSSLQASESGGPWRKLRINIVAVNSSGESSPGTLQITDNAPSIVQNMQIEKNNNTINISCEAQTNDVTGYLAVRTSGTNLSNMSDVLEYQIISNPTATFTVAEYPAYFSIAARDAFFDISGNYTELNFAPVKTVEA